MIVTIYVFFCFLATGNPPRIPEVAQDIIINQPVFWKYPKLLPGIGFSTSREGNQSKHVVDFYSKLC